MELLLPMLEKMAHDEMEMNCDDLLHLCNTNKECHCGQVFGMESWNAKQMLWTCCMRNINRLLRNDDFWLEEI